MYSISIEKRLNDFRNCIDSTQLGSDYCPSWRSKPRAPKISHQFKLRDKICIYFPPEQNQWINFPPRRGKKSKKPPTQNMNIYYRFTIVILLHNIFGLSNIIYFVIEKVHGWRNKNKRMAGRERGKSGMNIHELQKMNTGRTDGRK